MPCREHLSQLWQHKEKLDELNIRVCVVTFDDDVLARNYWSQVDWDWPLLIDQEKVLYDSYALGRGDWWSIYGPASIWQYLKLIFKGRMPGTPGADFRQFGGDVLIDPEGRVQLRFASCTPHDRPSVESILSVANGADFRDSR